MIKKLIALLIPVLLFLSCAGIEKREDRTGFDYSIAAAGDSITYGYGIVNKHRDSYPSQLGRMLGSAFLVENFGRNGATLISRGDRPYMGTGVFEEALSFGPDFVVICLGTNDSKRGNREYLDDFVQDYLELIRVFGTLDSHPRIFICYPPPVFGQMWTIDNSIIERTILPAIDRVARTAGVEIIDLYSPLKNRGDLFPDGIHPDAEGAGIIAGTILKSISPYF